MKKIVIVLLLVMAIVATGTVLINNYIVDSSSDNVYFKISELPEKQTIIVLGSLVRGNELSLVLEDRVISGIHIYNEDKGEKLLLSGDHSRKDYDEVNSMREYIQMKDESIKDQIIFMDHAGFDTYDSMYRAKEIFEVESAIIVTQDFHINRAVYIANQLGIDAVGYSVNEEKYNDKLKQRWRYREKLSRVKAFLDVLVDSKPKYLGEKIPIEGDGRLSWD